MLQLLKPVCLEPLLTTREATEVRSPHAASKSSPRSSQLEKSLCNNKDPAHSKINKIIYACTHKGTEPELEWASLDPVSGDLGKPQDEPN